MKALSRTVMYGVILLWTCVSLTAHAGAPDAGRVLVIENGQTGQTYQLPVNDRQQVTIRFFHSYDRQWVEESFRIENERFVPSEVTFIDDSYDYRHQRYQSRQVVEERQLRLLEIEPLPSDKLASIMTRVAFTRSQQLVFHDAHGNRAYDFTEWGQPGQRLIFTVRK